MCLPRGSGVYVIVLSMAGRQPWPSKHAPLERLRLAQGDPQVAAGVIERMRPCAGS